MNKIIIHISGVSSSGKTTNTIGKKIEIIFYIYIDINN